VIVRVVRTAVGLAAAAGLVALMLLPALARADALDDSVRRVAMQLQCPVCEGENVADSPSGLAGDMRSVIRTKVLAGEADQQILDEFVASYGDGILTEPPKRGISLGVWLGPVIGVVFGALVLVMLLSAWRRTPSRSTIATSVAALDADVADEFHRFREELGR
jgi:cytochrome c-type biogenesis protein CcmH